MNVDYLYRQLGLSNPEVLIKAKEYQRLLALRLPGGLGQGEICKPVVCLELACSQIFPGKTVSPNDFVRYGCVPPKIYRFAHNAIVKALDVRPKLTLRELVLQFGCAKLEAAVTKALAAYRQRFLATLPTDERPCADFSRSVFLAAAFHLCARRHHVRIDRRRLLSQLAVSDCDFASTVSSMTELCADLVGVEEKKKTKTKDGSAGKKRQRESAGGESAEEGNNEVAGEQRAGPAGEAEEQQGCGGGGGGGGGNSPPSARGDQLELTPGANGSALLLDELLGRQQQQQPSARGGRQQGGGRRALPAGQPSDHQDGKFAAWRERLLAACRVDATTTTAVAAAEAEPVSDGEQSGPSESDAAATEEESERRAAATGAHKAKRAARELRQLA